MHIILDNDKIWTNKITIMIDGEKNISLGPLVKYKNEVYMKVKTKMDPTHMGYVKPDLFLPFIFKN